MRSLLALAAVALASTGTSDTAPADLPGTYRLEGEGRVDPRPFPPRQAELHADAVVTSRDAGGVHLQLSGPGMTCDLEGTVDAGGTLTLARGQRCASDLRNDLVDGRLEARLVSGSGWLRGDQLELEVSFTVSGAIRLKSTGLLGDLATRLSGGTTAEPVPVNGEGRARARGWRDRSRAGSIR